MIAWKIVIFPILNFIKILSHSHYWMIATFMSLLFFFSSLSRLLHVNKIIPIVIEKNLSEAQASFSSRRIDQFKHEYHKHTKNELKKIFFSTSQSIKFPHMFHVIFGIEGRAQREREYNSRSTREINIASQKISIWSQLFLFTFPISSSFACVKKTRCTKVKWERKIMRGRDCVCLHQDLLIFEYTNAINMRISSWKLKISLQAQV